MELKILRHAKPCTIPGIVYRILYSVRCTTIKYGISRSLGLRCVYFFDNNGGRGGNQHLLARISTNHLSHFNTELSSAPPSTSKEEGVQRTVHPAYDIAMKEALMSIPERARRGVHSMVLQVPKGKRSLVYISIYLFYLFSLKSHPYTSSHDLNTLWCYIQQPFRFPAWSTIQCIK